MSVSGNLAAKRREIEQAEAELRRLLGSLGELGVTCIYDRDMQPRWHIKPGYDVEKVRAVLERAAKVAASIARLRAELGDDKGA